MRCCGVVRSSSRPQKCTSHLGIGLGPERTPTGYRRDLYRARLVIGQLRDEAMASGESFQVADLALDADALTAGESNWHWQMMAYIADFYLI